MTNSSPVKLIFGAGGIGEGRISHTWVNGEQASELLEVLKELDLLELDSGAAYPPGSPWVTEGLLGESKAVQKGFLVDTKILPQGPQGGLGLSEAGIDASVKKSFELLGVDQVNILYSHVPDEKVPVEESARAFDKHYRAGRFKQLGLCNYSTAQMKEWLEICEKHNYVKPTIYQGHYNAIKRTAEEDLYPLLRQHGIKIFAYGPLAGGFLTGKVSLATEASTLSGGRWEPGRFPIYPEAFGKPATHNAMIEFCKKSEAAGLTPTEVSLRWIMHHSVLRKGDAIILGATKIDQLRSNVELCKKGPLSEDMIEACEELWKKVASSMNELFG
ncbi:related to aflatoxin B1 aldehyde reductase [Phialocephala subalpina]|uniref:Related to aflatoxin B1 aldehyde reductase n=1 Tax=Phialocephala subalpina TaxID=576137 RepID=A0A1L7XF26_9HELO|nr:related to aflatoxin B1 aldehyde reductase [Phialocephala subalpina]